MGIEFRLTAHLNAFVETVGTVGYSVAHRLALETDIRGIVALNHITA